MRRILKTPLNASITNDLLIDYVNRFTLMDMPAQMQLFDFKTQYQFITQPGVDQYNMPLYNVQSETFNNQIPITNANQANPCILTCSSNFQIGQIIGITGVLGMTQLNNNFYTVIGLTPTTVTINVDSSGFNPYTSGGTATGPNNNNSVVQEISMFPVYQGFVGPVYINGIQVSFETQQRNFFNIYPNVVQQLGVISQGNGTTGPYTLQFPIGISNSTPVNPPVTSILRGHVDITGIIATNANVDPPLGTTLNLNIPTTSIIPAIYINTLDSTNQNMTVCDSGQFLSTNINYGLLMSPGKAPFGNQVLSGGYSATSNTINYLTGQAIVTFPSAVPQGTNISAQCYFFQPGLPRAVLYYNNVITLRSVPDSQYVVQLEAYLTPAAFFNSAQAIPFGYMAEYIARGAARKIMIDTNDVEQIQFYEPFFKEQESYVWKRSLRQFTSTRTQTIYSQGLNGNNAGFFNMGTNGF